MLEYLNTIGLSGPPRATAFVVSVYGDAIDPRGGTLWMGSLIEICAAQGLSESLVRTSVSRLVAGGNLVGERIGRKSYYRLSEAARAEFHRAAQILFAPVQPAQGWLTALNVEGPLPVGWAQVAHGVAIAPNRSGIVPPDGIVLAGDVDSGAAELPEFAAKHWPLAEVARRYNAFIGPFSMLQQSLRDGQTFSGADALGLRLRLIHRYRHAALKDPILPSNAMPEAWPAARAQAIFTDCYRQLTQAADAYIGQTCVDADGGLPVQSDAVARRLEALTPT